MRKGLFLWAVMIMIVSVCLWGLAGCAEKKIVVKEAAQPPAMEQPAPEPEAVPPMAEGEQKVTEEAMQLEDIHFDFDKYNLRPGDRKILSGHADWLLKNENYKVTIEGNCDERGTEEYNMALGQRRATTAMNYLVNMGVKKSRISTISYGKDRPLDPGHNEEAWAKNRRDHFVLQEK